MMRLIDADDLKNTFRQTYRYCFNYKQYKRLQEEKQIIDNAPTVDYVPVVRCRDCRFYEEGIRYDGSKCMVCGIYPFPMSHNPDDYCSHGERKGGADDADS